MTVEDLPVWWGGEPIPEGYVIKQTNTKVGLLGIRATRRRAERLADRFNGLRSLRIDLLRPVHYRVEREGPLRWAIVAYQNVLEKAE